MAVEIPVIVDIEGAFQDAANRAKAAMAPLERTLSKEALNIPIATVKIDEEDVAVTLKMIKDGGAEAFGGLERLIDVADKRLAHFAATGKKADFTAMLEAVHYMRDMATGADVTRNSVIALAQTMEGLQARVSAASATLQRSKLDSPEWEKAAKELAAATAEVQRYEARIQQLGQNTGSLTQMNQQLQQLRQQWANMAPTEMFDASGKLSESAASLRSEYTATAIQAERISGILTEQVTKIREQQRAEEELRKAQAERERVIAMAPKSIDDYNAKIQALRATLQGTDVRAPMFDTVARQLADVEKAAERVQRMVSQLGMNTGSIDSLSVDLQRLKKRWESMAETEMFDPSGKLSAYADATRSQIMKITKEMERRNKLLNEQIEKERQAEAERKRRDAEELRAIEREIAAEERQAEAARRHREELNMAVNSLDTLNTKLRAWQQEVGTADFSSSGFSTAVRNAEALSRALSDLNAQMKIIGANTGSIGQLNAKMQRLVQNYNALSESDRKGAAGQSLITEARKISQALEKEAQGIDKIIQKEQRLSEQIKKTAQQRKYEAAVLNTTKESMKILQAQERILSDRLASAAVGSKKYENLAAQLQKVRGRIAEINGELNTTNSVIAKQSRLMQNVNMYASMYVSAFGALRFIKQIRDVTAELEYQRVALQHLIQDEEYGAHVFEEIKKRAVESPFRIKDLVNYTKQLGAYRVEQEYLVDTTSKLADVSAGLGVDMNRLILAYGQVRAASVLRGQELRQFTEAGIPLVDLLAEKMGELRNESLSTADVFRLISERAVPFSAIADIFEDLTEKGGMFYQMQETQAKTLKGRWEKLKDTYDIAMQSIVESKGLFNFQRANDFVLAGLRLLANGLQVVPKAMAGYTVALVAYKLANLGAGKAVRQLAAAEYARKNAAKITAQAQMMGIKNVQAYTAAIVKQRTAVTLLGKAFYGLKAAFIANPWGMAIGAALGLATAFFSFKTKTDDATESLNSYKKAVEDYAKQVKENAAADKLIDRFRRLSETTERTSAQNKRLATTIERLKDIYPGFTDILNNNNLSVQEQADALQNAADNAEKLNRQAAESVYNEMQTTLSDLKDNIKGEEKQLEVAENRARSERERARKLRDEGNMADAAGAEREAQRADRRATKLREKLEPVKEQIESITQAMQRMEYYLFPDKALDRMEEWKKTLIKIQKENFKEGEAKVFDDPEIEKMESVFDLSKKLKKRIEDLRESIKGMKEQIKSLKPPADINKALDQIADKEKVLKVAELIKEIFGFIWPTGAGYQQDPWIVIFKNRLKFVQDFTKGVQDMNKYMSETDAIAWQREIMKGRGLSLGFNGKDDISVGAMTGSRAEVLAWYDDTIEKIQRKIAEKGGEAWRGLGVQAILAKDTKSRTIKAWQDLLAEVFNQKTDFQLGQVKNDFEEAFRKMKDEIKNSGLARNFYNDILDLTGDKDIATNLTVSIYGDVGQDFQQLVDKELQQAFNSLDIDKIDMPELTDITFGIATQDFSIINKYLDYFPKEWRERLQEMAKENQTFNANFVKGIYERYKKAEDFEDRRNRIRLVESQKREEITAKKSLPDEEKKRLISDSENYEARELAKVDVEELKATYEWRRAFEDLDRTSTETLSRMKTMIGDLIRKQSEFLSPEQLKALQEAYDKIRESENKRMPFQSISANAERASIAFGLYQAHKSGNENRIKRMTRAVAEYNKTAAEGEKIDMEHVADSWKDAVKNVQQGVEGLQDYLGTWQNVVSALKSVSDAMKDALGIEEIPIVDEAIESIGTGLQFIAAILPVITALQAVFNATAEANPIIAIATAIVAVISLIIGLVKGALKAETERLNGLIEEQKKLVDRLKESYDNLADAAEDAFGSEYIENTIERMRVLRAEIEAARKQADYERSKPLKDRSDEDYEEYLKNAREAARELADVQNEISERFLGSGRADAATDFADAWIDAYKQFSPTADAITEKFKDMMDNMVVQSLAANVINKRLKEVFDMVEDLSTDDKQLSIADAAKIAQKMTETTGIINADMTNLMNALSAAGLDIRSMGTGLTGIARDIQGASEESILGLAAGINTQNFFMSQINENVLAILQQMRTGGEATGTPSVDVPYIQTQEFRDRMKSLDENVAELVMKINRIVVANGTTSQYYVPIK